MKYFFLLAVFLCPLFVSAHATPTLYSPGASEVLSLAPGEVVITFSERIEPSASRVVVHAPEGITQGEGAVMTDNPRVFRTQLIGSAFGAYSVSWQVVSRDDGHFTKGAYVFFVGTTSAPTGGGATFSITHSATRHEAGTITLKLFGEGIIIGIFALTFLLRFSQVRKEIAEALSLRIKAILLLGIVILCGGAFAYLFVKTYALHTLQELAYADAFLAYAQTSGGGATIMLIVLCIPFAMLAIPLIGGALHRPVSRKRLFATFVVFIAMTYTQASLSHARASELLPDLSVGINMIHLWGKGLWIGGLLVCLCVLPVFVRAGLTTRDLSTLRTALLRLVAVAIMLGGTSGAWIVWLHLKDTHNLFTTSWGEAFMLLGFLAAVLLLLRLASTFVLERFPACIRCLFAYHTVEALLGVLVLFASAQIIITTPPLEYELPPALRTESREGVLTLREDPARKEELLLEAFGGDGERAFGVPVVHISEAQKGIGPIVLPVTERFVGGYGISLRSFSPDGTWVVRVAHQRKGAYDIVGTFTLHVPETLIDRAEYAQSPRLNTFTLLHIAVAVGALLFGVLLLFLAEHRSRRNPALPDLPVAPGSLRDAVLSAFALALAIICATYLLTTLTEGDFKVGCERAGGHWHVSVPEERGTVTHDVAKAGCMVEGDDGVRHIVSPEELAYVVEHRMRVGGAQAGGATHEGTHR